MTDNAVKSKREKKVKSLKQGKENQTRVAQKDCTDGMEAIIEKSKQEDCADGIESILEKTKALVLKEEGGEIEKEMEVVELRDYQKKIVEQVLGHLEKNAQEEKRKNVLVYLPTGGGKTVIASELLRRFIEVAKGKSSRKARCMFVVNRNALIDQTSKTFDRFRLDYGFIKSKYPETPEAVVQIASIQTLFSNKRTEKVDLCLDQIDLILIDEAHGMLANQYLALLELFESARFVGLTATPFRMKSEESLASVFECFVKGPSVSNMMHEKYLVPLVHIAPSAGKNVRVSGKVAETEVALKRAVKRWQEKCDNKITIAFCSSIKQSKMLIGLFEEAGILAAHIDGKTPEKERKRLFDQLENNDIQVLSSVGVLSEGFDVRTIESVILLRPTESRGLYIQQVGRGLRIAEGKKHCTVLDEVGNIYRHGPVDGPLGFVWEELEQENESAAKAQARILTLVKTCRAEGCDAVLHRDLRQTRCHLCSDKWRKEIARRKELGSDSKPEVDDVANMLASQLRL